MSQTKNPIDEFRRVTGAAVRAVSEHNDIQVHCPKDQGRLQNRVTLLVESRLPGPFYFAKRLAV